jgi:hypothetical protein
MASPVLSKTDSRKNVDDPRWHLVQRIVVSRSMGRSPLLSEFLLYICDRHLRNQPAGLTEQRIGVHVFGRSEGYNSNDDNIVRNYARTLRKRVEDYFATEGKHEDLRLEIPRGAYVPVFYSRPLENLPQPEETPAAADAWCMDNSSPDKSTAPSLIEETPLPAKGSVPLLSRRRRLAYPFLALCLILAAVIVTYCSLRGFPHAWHAAAAPTSQPISPSDALWSQLFQKERNTFVVPADSGLVIMQGLTRQPVSLGDYVSGKYQSDGTAHAGISAGDVRELGTRRYTSIVDLNLVLRLSRLKQVVPERMMVCYARDLRMDDVRSDNAILLGSVDANPWVGLFERQLNFRFSFDPKSDSAPVILNQHPLAGEQLVYANHHDGSWHSTFGRIAYLPNLDGSGHILLIGGLNMAGTQAAGEFVLNPDLMRPTLDHARGPNGSIRPFEILIETSNVAANASSPRVVSERVAPF